jgi:hypothetical protein
VGEFGQRLRRGSVQEVKWEEARKSRLRFLFLCSKGIYPEGYNV